MLGGVPSLGPESTTRDVIAGVDLRGRRAVVTGGSGGLGEETARALASAGAEVVVACRDAAKGDAAAARIRSGLGGAGGAVSVAPLDLASPASVRAFAERFLGRREPLHLLLNNAGVMACPLARTAEGYELQFATNHLGHFLLTGLLAPALRAGAPARVVNVSSAGHRFSPVVFEDVHYERRPYDKWEAYGQAKTANVLHAVALDRRLRGAGVRAFALHPGGIVTELGRHLSPDDVAQLRARSASAKLRWKTVEQGAATSVWAATAPELEGQGGLYLEDCRVGRPKDSADDAEGYAPWALDPAAAERLWSASEAMVGERFAF
jgi:NAD(P)-dependent dehydrogenase (short-subunit alcohol dehydrogenase family)